MKLTYDYTITDNEHLDYSRTAGIRDDNNRATPGALLFPRYSRLDGRFENASSVEMYVSNQISDAACSFGDAPPVLKAGFDRFRNCSGLHLRFNSYTGDYPKSVTVRWLSDSSVLETNEVDIDEAELYLYRDIENFSAVELTFHGTSKPYRPVFVEYIGFISLRVHYNFLIGYDGRAPGAADHISISSNSTWTELSEPEWITKNVGHNLALCCPRYSKLNGLTKNQKNFKMAGWVSEEYSDAEGVFTNPPIVEVSFSDGYYTSAGINISTGWTTGGPPNWVSLLNISWRRDGMEVANADFVPTSRIYFCEKSVERFNVIVLTFKETATPYRPVVLSLVELGKEEIYTAEQISSNETISEISQISEELTANSLDFSLKVGRDLFFKKQQELSIYFDGVKQGAFYVKSGKRSSYIDYDVYAEDAISLLDETWYGYPTSGNDGYYGWYNNTLSEYVYWVLNGTGVSYQIDDSIKNLNVFGYMPVCTRRKALQQVAFAVGAIIDTFGSDTIRFVPRDETKQPTVVPANKIRSLSVEDLDEVSKVVLTVHNFVLDSNNGTGQIELFNSKLGAGTHKVSFNEPCVVFGASNVLQTYFNSAINLAFVTPVDPEKSVILTGYKQVDNTVEISVTNPRFADAKQNQNVVKVENAYFVHSGNAEEVLQRVYQYYTKRKKVTAELADIEVSPGDMVTLPLYDNTFYTGMVERVTSTYSSRVFRTIVIR